MVSGIMTKINKTAGRGGHVIREDDTLPGGVPKGEAGSTQRCRGRGEDRGGVRDEAQGTSPLEEDVKK